MPVYMGHETVAGLIRDTMRAQGVTGYKLAQTMRRERSTLSRAINNARMTFAQAAEIAAALGCDLIVDFRPHDGPEE